MEKLKQYKYIILILLIILGFSFYWYSYRPYNITKLCIISAVVKANEIKGDQTGARYYFWKCQKQHGLTD